jgi:solute carrier family 6 amino acid transporter-like protein 5/7/9/14
MVTLVICSSGFLLGLVYVTPGGQHVLDVVDFFGGGFIIFVIAVVEVTAICWIYGELKTNFTNLKKKKKTEK